MSPLHGFDVVSVEFLPLTGATAAIKRMAPQIEMVDGDGSKLLTDGTLLRPQDAARTMVIFDGEKRFDAYKTFLKVRHLLAVAIFDDTSIDGESWAEGEEFKRHLSERRDLGGDDRPSVCPLHSQGVRCVAAARPAEGAVRRGAWQASFPRRNRDGGKVPLYDRARRGVAGRPHIRAASRGPLAH